MRITQPVVYGVVMFVIAFAPAHAAFAQTLKPEMAAQFEYIVRVQADERWDFSHDRIREVAYSQIGPARRQLIHRRIAQGMELLFANRLDEVSASIAVHLDRGGHPARAIPFLERAAAVATRVSANEEAIRPTNLFRVNQNIRPTAAAV